MDRVLVGYDGSEGARDALRLAAALAGLDDAELCVACVWVKDLVFGDVAANEAERARWFADRRAELERALDGRSFRMFEPSQASAAAALHDLAELERADMVVLGSTHRGRLGRLLPGSVGERLLHAAPCAVAIAPHGYAGSQHFGLGIVGVGYDGRRESRAALEVAWEFAVRLDATLRVITVAPPEKPHGGRIGLADVVTEHYEEQLAEAIAELGAGDRAESALRHGDPAAALAGEGTELDLLVVGSRAYGPVLRTLIGEVSHEVMRTSPCPVIVVPRPSLEESE